MSKISTKPRGNIHKIREFELEKVTQLINYSKFKNNSKS